MADTTEIAISSSVENNGDLSIYTVNQLKKYLANRRQNVSGRKADLIQRVQGSFRLGIQSSSTLAQFDQFDSQRCEVDRFTLSSGMKVPPPLALSGWTRDFNSLPDVMERDIYNYIVLKKNSKRQLKSKAFYDDGHVHKVEAHPINDSSSHMYIRALVLPSFPSVNQKKSPDYRPWVLLSKVTGCVHSAYCTCPAGEGECCNHIGALLFGIADLTEKRKNGCLASTSRKCLWSDYSMSAPRKRKLSPKRSEELVYKKNTLLHSTRKLHVEKNSDHNKNKGCTVDIDRFKKRLEEKKLNVGWLKNFPSDSSMHEPEIPALHDIRFLFMDNVDLSSTMCKDVFSAHFKSLSQTEEDMHITEVLTRGQDSHKWKQARKERITSSHFGTVCKRKDDTPPENLLRNVMYSEFTSIFTEYGNKHEKAARKMYVKQMQKEHKGLKVKECGLFVCKDSPFLGSSPDGLVYCSHCEDTVGLLEIKCPASMKWRMETPAQCCTDKDFYCYLQDGKVKLKRSHKYYFQVQGQMGVTRKRWCDFVVWTCVGLSIERIPFDEEMWNDMYVKLENFYINYFIPELFSRRRTERGLKLYKL